MILTTTCFYANWDADVPYTEWNDSLKVSDKEKSITFSTPLDWTKMKQTINVYTDSLLQPTFVLKNDTGWKNIHLLKSQLQKAIRRGLNDIAVKTALTMIKVDCEALLRRLMVIMIEDSTLHNSFGLLMWLYAAMTHNYKITEKQVSWILSLVNWLALSQNCITHIDYKPISFPYLMYNVLHDDYPNDVKYVLYAIMLRVSYGGMAWDMNMLLQVVSWCLNKKLTIDDTVFEIIDYKTIPQLKDTEILYFAVDYHCCKQLITMVRQQHKNYTNSQIEKCVWECSSKINIRKETIIPEEEQELWAKIGETIVSKQKELAKRS